MKGRERSRQGERGGNGGLVRERGKNEEIEGGKPEGREGRTQSSSKGRNGVWESQTGMEKMNGNDGEKG